MVYDLKKDNKDCEKALEVLWNSPLGRNIMRDLRDHASMSKGSQEKFDFVEKRIDKLTITFFALFIGTFMGSSLVNWGIYTKTFEGHQKNLSTVDEGLKNDIYQLHLRLTKLENGQN